MSQKRASSKVSSRRQAARQRRQAALARRWAAIGAVLVIALIAIVAFAFQSGGESEAVATVQGVQEITVEEAYQKYQQGVFFLDVRTVEEWNEYHVPNTTLIPLDQLPARLNELPRDREIVVICRSGNRSQQGRDILLQAGFSQVTSMAGGLKQWSALGYPIEGTRP